MNTPKLRLIFICFSLISFSLPAFAGGYARLGALYLSSESGPEGSTTEGSRTLIDLGAGYVWSQGLTLGVLYGIEKEKSGSSSSDRTALGPTVGWISNPGNGVYILATYFVSVEKENYKGTGYQADLGYKFAMGKIALAPQISYRHIAYDELNGNKLATKIIDGNIDPYFVLWIEF